MTASKMIREAGGKTMQWVWWVILVLSGKEWGPLVEDGALCLWELNREFTPKGLMSSALSSHLNTALDVLINSQKWRLGEDSYQESSYELRQEAA